MSYTTNADGLVRSYGAAQGAVFNIGSPEQAGPNKRIVVDIRSTDLSAFGATNLIFGRVPRVSVPSGALIQSAVFITTTAFTGTSATLDVGLANADATEIDFDGLIAATTLVSINTVGKTVTGAGALVGTKISADAYITTNVNTATFTAGAGQLVISYFVPTP